MSYARVDHAGWLERNIGVAKEIAARSAPVKAGAHRGRAKGLANGPDKLSAFQARAIDIIGMVLGGIYNAPIVWNKIEWSWGAKESIAIPTRTRGLSTFDDRSLTRFVLLCHAARIRGEIRPHGPRGLLFILSQRGDAADIYSHHPDLDEMMADFAGFLPAEHRVWIDQPSAPAGNESVAA